MSHIIASPRTAYPPCKAASKPPESTVKMQIPGLPSQRPLIQHMGDGDLGINIPTMLSGDADPVPSKAEATDLMWLFKTK